MHAKGLPIPNINLHDVYYSFPESDRHSAQDGDEELVIILVGPCGVRLCRHFDYLQDDFIWERVKGRHGSGRGRPRPSDNGFRFTVKNLDKVIENFDSIL